MRKLAILILFLCIQILSFGQELNARVQVSGQQIQGSVNKEIFQTLQKSLFEFVNNRKWTNHIFSAEERIECTFQINITEQVSSDNYKGSMQVQANRPVFGTNLNTVLINYRDIDIQFQYVENQPLEFNENSHGNNLVAVISYWSYVILGMDYDSFSPKAGTEFFSKAENIVNNAQNAVEPGWKAFESQKNRYWFIQNILDSKYAPIRDFMYQYHRLGLDVMSEKASQGRAKILESLSLLQKVYREKPSPYMPYLQLIFDAKADEFVNVFSEGAPDEKIRAFNILSEINPSNMNKYNKIKEQ
ncbi:MAG: DUF4835 family protein [Bacteroidales bacterium]|nr:DUF4835 family protein [Bacteroidales bacterium]